jgi:hypothetical protein
VSTWEEREREKERHCKPKMMSHFFFFSLCCGWDVWVLGLKIKKEKKKEEKE